MSTEEELYVDGETLIAEVKKRPLLYDPSLSEYSDRNKRLKCWDEVCEQMIPNWEPMSPIEKHSLSRDIQKRWRSIRDSFMKDYKKRRMQNGPDAGRGKRYIFYKQMLFILPTIGKRRNAVLNSEPESISQDVDIYETLSSDAADEMSTEKVIVKPPAPKRLRMDSIEKEPKKSVLQCPQQEDDEDKMFLLSLLPLFKIMKEDVKLTARIKVLETVRQSLLTDSYLSFPSVQHQTTVLPTQSKNFDTQTVTVELPCQSEQTSLNGFENSSIEYEETDQPSTPPALSVPGLKVREIQNGRI